MARKPYRIARQQHLGDALDELERAGRLSWRWEYDYTRSRAIFHIRVPDATEQALDTRAAEKLVVAMVEAQGERWLPVPHPGGERQLEETLKRMSDSQ